MVKQTFRFGLFIFTGLLVFNSCEDKKEKNTTDLSSSLWFVKTYGGNRIDYGTSVQQTNDGGYIITGETRSFSDGNDAWLIKTDSLGKEEWNSVFGSSGDNIGNSVQQTNDGGYIIVGWRDSTWSGNKDVWLIKTDSQGKEEWNKIFGGSKSDSGSSVRQTNDGGYIITGVTNSFEGGYNIWLIKTDSHGNEEWNKELGGHGSTSVQQTLDGGYIITGSVIIHEIYGKKYSIYLIKTDSEGNKEWDKTFGGSKSDHGNFVQQTTDGGYIIVGNTESFGNGESDVWLIKTDFQGNEEWNKTFGGENYDSGLYCQQTTDGGYIVVGGTGGSKSDAWLIKTDSQGNEEWNQTFLGNDSNDGGYFGQQTKDGGYIITGSTSSIKGYDVLLIKTDSNGNTLL